MERYRRKTLGEKFSENSRKRGIISSGYWKISLPGDFLVGQCVHFSTTVVKQIFLHRTRGERRSLLKNIFTRSDGWVAATTKQKENRLTQLLEQKAYIRRQDGHAEADKGRAIEKSKKKG
jgi:hypothetical protein